MAITIFHNPDCSTSRNTLALIRNSGDEPRIVEYIETPPSRAELEAMIAASGRPVRDFVRRKDALYATLARELAGAEPTDGQLLDMLCLHPVLLERPIVVTPLGTRLCRPLETVLEVLPSPQRGPFLKENGEPLIDAQGRRIGA
jgi:arsenate reductase (glutaredoxin)